MIFISPNKFSELNSKTMIAISALEKINKIIREHINDSDDPENHPLNGIDNILECLAYPLLDVASDLEEMKDWANATNTDIEFRQYYGDKTLIRDRNNNTSATP